MKKTIYTLCAGVFALLTVIGCSKSDDNDSKKNKDKNATEVTNFNIPKEAKTILPDKTLTEMVANGMTIHEGTNLPNIQGIKNLVYVLTVTQKEDSNNKIMKVGTYRIFTHYESIAQKVTVY